MLIVDDDPGDARDDGSPADGGRVGCQPRQGTAGSALQRLAEQTPTVIVLDLLMPELDGFTLHHGASQHAGVARRFPSSW